MSTRMANNSNCSIRIRRAFLRTAASRYSIAAQGDSRCLRRFQRWMMIGTAAASAQSNIKLLANGQNPSGA